MQDLPRIALTPGEPAGVGPDLVIALAQERWNAEIVAIADPQLLAQRSRDLGIPIRIDEFDLDSGPEIHCPGILKVLATPLGSASRPGQPDPANAPYVLETLRKAAYGCKAGKFSALVTGPVQKSVINEAGIPFSGHTEFLAELTGGHPVMLLTTDRLRVALLTTHLPLVEVSRAVTRERVLRVVRILNTDLRERFKIQSPRITVCGLNPHAGEAGHLGSEENEVIVPAIEILRDEGLTVDGPVPADTAFTNPRLETTDVVLAMYHDQGLPVLKHAGFGKAVNVTLGLPIIRTSVDHGTALDLAATGRAAAGSFKAALDLAISMARR